MESWKIFLVDDHQLIRDGMRHILESDPRVELVGEAANGKQALERLARCQADLVFLDISMPEMDGLATCQALREKYPHLRILMLSMYGEAQKIKQLMAAGANGYLLKNSSEAEIKKGVETVMKGQNYFSEDATEVIMQSLSSQNENESNLSSVMPLSRREKEVLKLILKEYSNAQIAAALYISPRTVDAHKRNLLEKTGSKNLAGLVLYAFRNGLAEDIR
jgi:DNA-binding NarL/FixJ family response regulator